jgi:hypothetical protein
VLQIHEGKAQVLQVYDRSAEQETMMPLELLLITAMPAMLDLTLMMLLNDPRRTAMVQYVLLVHATETGQEEQLMQLVMR